MTIHLSLFILIQTIIEPRKKAQLIQQLSQVIQDQSVKDRSLLMDKLDSAVNKDLSVDLEPKILEQQPAQKKPIWDQRVFLQGIVVGAAASSVTLFFLR